VKYIIVSDFFLEDFVGGAALNDEEVLKIFEQEEEEITKVRSENVTLEFLEENKDAFYIISNFFSMPDDSLEKLKSLNYLLYAHDYKFVKHMNPAAYEEFKVPEEDLIHVELHQKAKSVICQSKLQEKIYQDNIPNVNTVNFSGNLWSNEIFSLLEALSSKEKRPIVSVIKSRWHQKGVPEAIKFCMDENYDYDLVHDEDYSRFLWKLSENQALAFYPLTPETCSRIVLECKMMNIKVFITKMVGACHEPWFEKQGIELISLLREKRKEIYKVIKDISNNATQ
jgi:hypothetical protein